MTQVATIEPLHEMQFAYRYPADEIVKMLDSDATQGLTAAQAQQYLQRYGANALPEPAAPPAWRKLLSQFEGPLTVLLLLAMGVSVFAWLKERDTPIPFEALTILAIVLLNGLLGYIQENRAEQAVAALQAMENSKGSRQCMSFQAIFCWSKREIHCRLMAVFSKPLPCG